MKLQALVQSLEIGQPVAAANLTMFPLLVPGNAAATSHPDPGFAPGAESAFSTIHYLTLDEGLAAGFVKVTEVSDAGSVPELTLVNDGDRPVLVLDGEELVGAKQNRIVNLTILVPPRTRLPLPVSCVEAGRWSHRSRAFAAAGRAHYAAGRAKKLEQVSCCMKVSGQRHADQGAVWDDIEEKAARMAAHSDTRAAAAMYEKSRAQLDEFQGTLQALPNQVGAVFAIDGAIAGLEVFDAPGTWRKSMRKIVESYGLDALDRREGGPAKRKPDPARFLASVARAEAETFPAVGMGQDLRLKSRHLSGAALALDDEIVHALAFAC